MASERQIAANRRNALLSCGPKTQAGKLASSRNAVRHGLTARNNDYLDGVIEYCLQPENEGERRLAQSVAGDHSRLTKARSLRNTADPHTLSVFERYERSSYRSMQKNLQLLNEMQDARRTVEQAKLLGTRVPDPNGFGFVNDKIAA
jgi:hypothetical protein